VGLDKVASLSVGFVTLKVGQGGVKWGGIKLLRWKFNEKEGEDWVYNFFPSKGGCF
jgi:hypothetical protein